MQQLRLTTFTLLLSFIAFQLQAQNWVNGGNTLSANGSLGTNSNHSLLFETNSIERGRITNGGNWGINTASPIGKFHVNGLGSFGNRVTAGNALRALNLADDNAVMRVLRVHPSFAPAVELISRTSADGPNVAYWDFYAEPSDKSFRIRDRVGGGSGLDRLTINSNGNVGIGTTEPLFPFEVLNATSDRVIHAVNTFSGQSDRHAIHGESINLPGYGVGVRGVGGFHGVEGIAEGGSYASLSFPSIGVIGTAYGNVGAGQRRGVSGTASGGERAYGVYGTASSASSFNAAGYFNGNVYANGVQLTSDRKFKRDIIPIENALAQLMKLRPSSYQFKREEYKGMRLEQGRHLGLIADEVKQVFPELVRKAIQPAEYEGNTRQVVIPEVEYESINYLGLTPVLIASVQELSNRTELENRELKKQLEKQQQQIEELQQIVSKLAGGHSTSTSVGGGALLQNTPNPSQGTTTIRYAIPDGTSSARLTLTNSKGQLLKTISINGRGAGQVNLDTSALSAGVYSYTLWIAGREVDTKQLVITR